MGSRDDAAEENRLSALRAVGAEVRASVRTAIRTAEEDFAEEERLAWDRYAAGATIAGVVNSITPTLAAKWADQLLEERRKRFGGPSK